MNNTFHLTQDLLDLGVPGFHQYVLSAPVHLCYVSRSLCDMTGYTVEELTGDTEDRYACLVHPADRNLYTAPAEVLARFRRLPASLEEAVIAAASSRFAAECLPAPILDAYCRR